MKLVVFGDSLIRPRPEMKEEDITEYEDTYAYKLRELYPNADILYIESLDTEGALFLNERMVAFRRPDVVIYHLGINDSVQRVFSKNSKSILITPVFTSFTRGFFLKVIHVFRPFIIRYFGEKKCYVGVDKFESNLLKMKDDVLRYSPECQFLAVSIKNKPDKDEKRSPGDNRLIDSYNKVIHKVFNSGYVDINMMADNNSGIISDGIHITKLLHKDVFLELNRRIISLREKV